MDWSVTGAWRQAGSSYGTTLLLLLLLLLILLFMHLLGSFPAQLTSHIALWLSNFIGTDQALLEKVGREETENLL